jgi:hypothetical protein
MEEWKPLSFNPDYLISSYGRVLSKKFNQQPIERILKNNNNGGGYDYVKIRGKNYYIHHLVYDHFVGTQRAEGFEIDHIDRDKHNNRISNLRYVSISENRLNRGSWKKSI